MFLGASMGLDFMIQKVSSSPVFQSVNVYLGLRYNMFNMLNNDLKNGYCQATLNNIYVHSPPGRLKGIRYTV